MKYHARMNRFGLNVLSIVSLLVASPIWAGEAPIVTTDLLRIRSVTSIDVAGDGSRAAVSVRSIATVPPEKPDDPEAQPTFQNQSHLFLVDLNAPDAAPRQLTFGERDDQSPVLSPDGQRIAFVRVVQQASTNDSGGTTETKKQVSQLWVLSVSGGEARQVTNFKHGCDSPRWSPDGSKLLIHSSIPISELNGVPPWPMERPRRTWSDATLPDTTKPVPDGTRAQIRAWLEHNAKRENPTVITRLEFQDELALRGEMQFAHLFLIAPDAPEPVNEQLAIRITQGFYDHTQAEFMPDGRSVVYVAKKPTDQHPDRVLATSLWQVNIDGSNDHEILMVDGWSLSAPKPARDGDVLGFRGEQMDEPAYRQTQLGMASLTGRNASAPFWLTDESRFPGSVFDFEWHPAQPATILFTTAMQGGFPLMMVSSALVRPAPLIQERDGQAVGIYSFDAGGGAIVYCATTPDNPCVLMVRDAEGDHLRWDLNPWVSERSLSAPTEGWISRPDGERIQYWLMQPTKRVEGQKYPLVLEIHGGPSAMWGPGEFTMWHEFQLLCSWGYGVVYCNPRGSGGYGYEFQRGNFQNWGEGPAGDVLAVVDQVILEDWVDRDRLLVTGGSYAGYLTAWIIAHDHRFKSAVAQRGVYDLETFFGEGNAWRLVSWCMGGNPYDPRYRQVIDRNSPFTYVNRITTPLLIMHASNDLRTGVSQSEMMYRALKELNRPVEYVRYPNAGHDLSRTGDPLQRMDRLNRIIEFFERHIENPREAPRSPAQAGG